MTTLNHHLSIVVIIAVAILGGATASIDESSNFNNPPVHVCGKVMSRRVKDIHFRSMTYYNPHQLVIFEGDRKYFIPIKDITPVSMLMPDSFLRWSDTELAESAKDLEQTEQFRSAYMINIGSKFALILATDKYERVMDIYNPGKPLEISQKPKVYPDYSIVHDQKSKSNAYGYVIHKDLYDGTDNFIIYQLWLEAASLTVNIQQASATVEEKNNAHYYYLQRTEDASKVRLVRRNSHKGDFHYQLLHSLPVGFMLQDRMYLFDSALACVYVIKDIRLDLYKEFASPNDIVRERINIPYERFFNCPYSQYAKMWDFPDSERCNTTIHSAWPFAGKPNRDGFGPMFAPQDSLQESTFTSVLICIAVVFVLLLAGVAFYFMYYMSNEDEQTANNNDTKKHKKRSKKRKKKKMKKVSKKSKSPKPIIDNWHSNVSTESNLSTSFLQLTHASDESGHKDDHKISVELSSAKTPQDDGNQTLSTDS